MVKEFQEAMVKCFVLKTKHKENNSYDYRRQKTPEDIHRRKDGTSFFVRLASVHYYRSIFCYIH